MFEHIQLLLSFVYALALTHLFASTTGLILARDRVRFSALQALWMLAALVNAFANWVAFYGLTSIKQWSLGQISLQFVIAIGQYFTCSLVAPRVEAAQEMDMTAFYERQRRMFTSAFAVLCVLAMIDNYVLREHTVGLSSDTWIVENIVILPTLALALLGGIARPRWLQWTGAVGFFAFTAWGATSFTMGT